MRILFLADHTSIHTKKWAMSLVDCGNEVYIFSLTASEGDEFPNHSEIQVHSLQLRAEKFSASQFSKLLYLRYLPALRRFVKQVQPDIVHAHYATSYGLLGVLSGHKKLIISVWGADVFDFPNNFIKKRLLRYILNSAKIVLSTSEVMAKLTRTYTNRAVEVTPFGIDTDKFKTGSAKGLFQKEAFVIGTVKTLEEKYGISYLMMAFEMLRKEYKNDSLKLLIVGKGSQEIELKELARELSIEEDVHFIGKIPNHKVPEYLNEMDVYVALSTLESESFGVAILEASSCEIPVVVSDVGGLPEVVENGKTGMVVPRKNSIAAYEAMKSLYLNEELRISMGKNGRLRVKEMYEWEYCLQKMIGIYNEQMRA
ncbi:MAG: glycosyltransferase [Vicingaceae bacterium]